MSLNDNDLLAETRRLPIHGALRMGLDIGGTQVRAMDSVGALHEYRSPEFRSVAGIIARTVISNGQRPGKIVLAPAGPRVAPGVARMTNLDWPLIDEDELEGYLGGETRVQVVNDMAAKAAGASVAESVPLCGTFSTLGLEDEPKLVTTVSTGVGDAVWTPDGILSGEGGHATWQPEDQLAWSYLRFLQKKYGRRVSVEHAISGKYGLPNLIEYFVRGESVLRPRCIDDINRYITERAMAEAGPCRDMMRIHAAILGQHLRNRVLAAPICYGGIYLTGGVMSAECVQSGWYTAELNSAFLAVGAEHAETIVAKIPVILVTDPDLGVKGALQLAMQD